MPPRVVGVLLVAAGVVFAASARRSARQNLDLNERWSARLYGAARARPPSKRRRLAREDALTYLFVGFGALLAVLGLLLIGGVLRG